MNLLGRVLTHDEEGFSFVTNTPLRAGEFVCYEDGGRHILSRVMHTTPLNQYPEEFLLEPATAPAGTAAFLGMEPERFGYLVTVCTVIGHFDKDLGEFCNPLTKPNTGDAVYLAPDEMLASISKVKPGTRGSANVGVVLGRKCPVVLSVKDIVSQHLSIIAATGSGKSYTVGVLLEEIMGPENRGAVLVFDPHGEYSTLTELMNLDSMTKKDYRPVVKVIRPEDIKIRIRDMTFSDICAVMDDGNMSDKMRVLMHGVYEEVKQAFHEKRGNFTYDELRRAIQQNREARGEDEATYTALLWRLQKLEPSPFSIFDDHMHQDLDEFFQIGQLTVLDMSGIEAGFQQLIAAVLLRRVFTARKDTVTKRNTPDSSSDKYLPYPVFIVLEEAHRFAPQNEEAKSKSMLKTVLSEGRKFGIGVCMISQRPAKLDQDSLSQCMTQITMRIINPIDQGQVAAALEALSRDLLDRLPSLAKGEAVISGMAINTPSIVKVRKRLTTHGGSDIDAPLEWSTGYCGHSGGKVEPDDDLDMDYLSKRKK